MAVADLDLDLDRGIDLVEALGFLITAPVCTYLLLIVLTACMHIWLAPGAHALHIYVAALDTHTVTMD